MDFTTLRNRMVVEQLIPRGIKDRNVLDAFRKIERQRFIPEELRESAYADFPIPIGKGQTISQPYIVALMTESLNLSGKEKILEIGTGSGYQTAILCELAKEVFSIERFDSLAETAKALLNELGYNNIRIKTGDGTLGWKEQAPFDGILVAAATPKVPEALLEQLNENGRLIIPLGESFSQILTLIEKKNNKFEKTEICGCVFVPLIFS